jgi:cytochrome c-type biogenesis protein CcmH/NrfG
MLSSTDKERYENAYLLALAYNRLNRRQEAIAQLENVLRIQPSFSPARELLNRLTARK